MHRRDAIVPESTESGKRLWQVSYVKERLNECIRGDKDKVEGCIGSQQATLPCDC